MTRLIPPYLFLALLLSLAALYAVHPPGLAMRPDAALPWDVPLPLGIALLIWARYRFTQTGEEIHTFRQPRALVTDGPFRYSRNPMYLGFFLILLAAAFFVNTWCALLAPFAFLLAAAFWYIPAEERALRAAFGTDYDSYAWTTRRWI